MVLSPVFLARRLALVLDRTHKLRTEHFIRDHFTLSSPIAARRPSQHVCA
jgi:hypothetical protein